MKEDKERAKLAAQEKAKPKVSSGASKPSSKPSGGSRQLPSYYGKAPATKPSAIAGRTRASKNEATKPASKASDSYKPSLRSRRGKPSTNEEQKYPSQPQAKPVTRSKKPVSYAEDVVMQDANAMDEIPAELLNQIYSEDIDRVEVESLQEKEYSQPGDSEPIGERLIDNTEGMHAPRAERRPSPPPADVVPPVPEADNEQALIQKAIEESLKQNNLRQHPMRKFLVESHKSSKLHVNY